MTKQTTVTISPEAYWLGNERNKGYSKFEFLFIKILQAHCSNPEFAKALPESICNMALQTTDAALEIMSARRKDPFAEFYEDEEPGLKQMEIDFSQFDSSAICVNCGERFGIHSAGAYHCPALDESHKVIDGTFVSNTFVPVTEFF